MIQTMSDKACPPPLIASLSGYPPNLFNEKELYGR